MKKLNRKRNQTLLGLFGFILLIATALLINSFGVMLFGAGASLAVLFTPGPLVDQLSKSIGRVTFSRNHFKQFARQRVKPINPKSEAQTSQRALVTTNSKAWKGLSQDDILGWNALAAQLKKMNRLGVPATWTGENLFVANNNNIASAHGTAIDTPPSLGANDVPSLAGIIITITGGVISMAFTPGTVATNIIEVSASPAMSGGRTYNSNFRVIATEAANTTSPFVLTTPYTNKFGVVATGTEVTFFKVRVIDSLTGFASASLKFRVAVS